MRELTFSKTNLKTLSVRYVYERQELCLMKESRKRADASVKESILSFIITNMKNKWTDLCGN